MHQFAQTQVQYLGHLISEHGLCIDPDRLHSVLSFPKPRVKVKVAQSCPTLCNATDFSRPEYWSGWLFPSPGDLPNPGIQLRSPALQVDSLPAEPPGKPKPKTNCQLQGFLRLVVYHFDNILNFSYGQSSICFTKEQQEAIL